MVRISTLNEVSQLRDSRFGQPKPRHGLSLLYWFANDCVFFQDGHMYPSIELKKGEYGFHTFYNRAIVDDDDERLLSDQKLQYYEVGNLYDRDADDLPDYVTKWKNFNDDNKNKDRIIVGLSNGVIVRVYVTQHSSRLEFDSSRTFRVSQGLISIIGRMQRDQFLQETVIFTPRFQNQSQRVNHNQAEKKADDSRWCTIL